MDGNKYAGVLIEPNGGTHDSGYPTMNVWGIPGGVAMDEMLAARELVSGNCDVVDVDHFAQMRAMDLVRGVQMDLLTVGGKQLTHIFYRHHYIHASGVSTVTLALGERRED